VFPFAYATSRPSGEIAPSTCNPSSEVSGLSSPIESGLAGRIAAQAMIANSETTARAAGKMNLFRRRGGILCADILSLLTASDMRGVFSTSFATTVACFLRGGCGVVARNRSAIAIVSGAGSASKSLASRAR
jgi:hypothetical protein